MFYDICAYEAKHVSTTLSAFQVDLLIPRAAPVQLKSPMLQIPIIARIYGFLCPFFATTWQMIPAPPNAILPHSTQEPANNSFSSSDRGPSRMKVYSMIMSMMTTSHMLPMRKMVLAATSAHFRVIVAANATRQLINFVEA